MVLLSFANTGCKKEQVLTSGGEVRFSADTLTFDTVFTAYASFTCSLKIFNPQNEKITLSSIRLENATSFFHLNINGIDGNTLKDVEIAAKDSIYVFATVNIDPQNQNNPYVISDKLIATLNGKDFSLPFIAYGQDAHYIDGEYLQTQTWLTDKPYVIIHSAAVDTDQTLTIPAGCKVYMNGDSRILVLGTLKVLGTKTDSVVFQGDRLDRGYFGNEGYPGEWGGIYFDSYSTQNEINYAVLKNCGNTALGAQPAAIQLSPDLVTDAVPQLTIRNTIIENSIGYGILSFQGSLKAENCLIHTCGAQALGILQGGQYEVTNCDFVIFSTDKINHQQEPTVALLNYFKNDATNEIFASNLNATLKNCVIWGGLEDEFFTGKVDDSRFAYNLTLDHCLIKTKEISSFVSNSGSILNQDPKFVDYINWNFRPQEGSPLTDAGVPSLAEDITGKPRNGATDIGCYEY
ncbi:MAG: hypothetical protein EOP51_17470 [Sphingobacteriales bacterium]|nr:MAG: hypothetical protein EOP51_17470 [Sphingobacteriales bacterium]